MSIFVRFDRYKGGFLLLIFVDVINLTNYTFFHKVQQSLLIPNCKILIGIILKSCIVFLTDLSDFLTVENSTIVFEQSLILFFFRAMYCVDSTQISKPIVIIFNIFTVVDLSGSDWLIANKIS